MRGTEIPDKKNYYAMAPSRKGILPAGRLCDCDLEENSFLAEEWLEATFVSQDND
jgi:hypothetical protein